MKTPVLPPARDSRYRILFICLGNICRSPAAHAIMQALATDSMVAHQLLIDSAGIGGWHIGQLPDSRMRYHGAQRGYAVDHRARQFDAHVDFDRFDCIVVMDEDNYRQITSMTQLEENRNKVVRMGDFLTRHPHYHHVPDPYYGGAADFKLALDLIEDGCQHLLQQIEILLQPADDGK